MFVQPSVRFSDALKLRTVPTMFISVTIKGIISEMKTSQGHI